MVNLEHVLAYLFYNNFQYWVQKHGYKLLVMIGDGATDLEVGDQNVNMSSYTYLCQRDSRGPFISICSMVVWSFVVLFPSSLFRNLFYDVRMKY